MREEESIFRQMQHFTPEEYLEYHKFIKQKARAFYKAPINAKVVSSKGIFGEKKDNFYEDF